MTGERVDRGLNIMLYAVAGLVVLTLVVGAFSLRAQLDSNIELNDLRESAELTGCRGIYLAAVLDGLSEVMLVQSEGLEALALDDDEALFVAISAIGAERQATRDALRDYIDAIERSTRDPQGFLEACRAINGTGPD